MKELADVNPGTIGVYEVVSLCSGALNGNPAGAKALGMEPVG